MVLNREHVFDITTGARVEKVVPRQNSNELSHTREKITVDDFMTKIGQVLEANIDLSETPGFRFQVSVEYRTTTADNEGNFQQKQIAFFSINLQNGSRQLSLYNFSLLVQEGNSNFLHLDVTESVSEVVNKVAAHEFINFVRAYPN